jgi:cytoskeletal protein CcmA (bactofilin family)
MQAQDRITVGEPIEDDLYLAGDTIRIEAEVDGDIFAAANSIRVESQVSQDVNLAANEVDIDGTILDDVRIAANTVNITESIGGDLIVVANTVEVEEGVLIEGDINIAAGTVEIFGEVAGDVDIYAEDIDIRGNIAGNLTVGGDSLRIDSAIGGDAKIASSIIVLDDAASFEQQVEYWTEEGEDFSFVDSIDSEEQVTYNEDLRDELTGSNQDFSFEIFPGGALMLWFLGAMSGILTISFIVLLASRHFRKAGTSIVDDTLKSAGVGALYFLLTPLFAVVLMLTIIGIPIGIFSMVIYIFSIVFALPIISVAGAYAIDVYQKLNYSVLKIWLISIALYIGLRLVLLIPFVGFFVIVVLALIAFGSLLIPKKIESDSTATGESGATEEPAV